MKKWMVLLAVLMASLLLFTGCFNRMVDKAMEKAIEKGIEKDSGAKVDISSDDGSVSVKGEDGGEMQIGGDVVWPDKISVDVPELKGVAFTMVSTDNNGGAMITFEKAKEKQIEDYISDLLGAGFEETSTMKSDDGIVNSYTKGEITVAVTFTTDDGTGMLIVSKNSN